MYFVTQLGHLAWNINHVSHDGNGEIKAVILKLYCMSNVITLIYDLLGNYKVITKLFLYLFIYYVFRLRTTVLYYARYKKMFQAPVARPFNIEQVMSSWGEKNA